jgi:hypothetical protein
MIGRVGLRGGKVFPLAPSVEINEGLHATPFFDFTFEPDEVHGLWSTVS